jgi:hypothetical protein
LVCTSKVYSGLGADIVMESLHSLIVWFSAVTYLLRKRYPESES